METNDLINGIFETFGAVLCWGNVLRLYKDKYVSGISWTVQAFFASWGLWNLYYYPSLGQWASFYGGIGLALGNIVWVVMALHYQRSSKI